MSPPHRSRRRRHITSHLSLLAILALSPLHILAQAPNNASPWTFKHLVAPAYARLSAAGSSPQLPSVSGLRFKNPHMNAISQIIPHSEAIIPVPPLPGAGSGGGSSSEGLIVPNVVQPAAQAAQAVAGIITPQNAESTPKGVEGLKLDLQTFGGSLGGIRAPAITMSNARGRPFLVGDDSFDDFASASMKTCDVQRGRCNLAAIRDNAAVGPTRSNGKGAGRAGEPQKGPAPRTAFTAVDCDQQKNQCEAAQRVAPIQTFNLENLGADPMEPEFDLICMA